MGGLTIGAWLTGRLRVVSSHRLRAYAILEIVVALTALILPILFRASLPLLSWAYSDGNAPVRFGLIRLLLTLGVLGLPTAAMGATFPIAASWFANSGVRSNSRSGIRFSSGAGMLYAANSAGAALGALAAGFWLIPNVSLSDTLRIAAGVNGICAFTALWISFSQADSSTSSIEEVELRPKHSKRNSSRQERGGRSVALSRPQLAYVAIAISGFLALAYEVAWTRLLELVIGPTTYAFTTMTVSFITGIALGSAVGARLSRRISYPEVWLAAMLGITSVSASLASWYASSRLPLLIASDVNGANVLFKWVIVREVLMVIVILLPMTMSLGAAFSFALAIASRGVETVAGDTGYVYAANTLGAIAGALAAGFLLLPRIGLHGSFVAMSYVGVLSSGRYLAALLFRGRTTNNLRAVMTVGAAAILAFLISLPNWDRNMLASGAYLYTQSVPAGQFQEFLRAGQLEYYKDGAVATVSIRRLVGSLSLAVDGKVDASNGSDMLTQRLLGLLPGLLHDKPQDVGIIGLGSGVTAGSILATGAVRSMDIIETSPQVVEASKFFSKENSNVLHAPGVRLIVGDGRSHLLLTQQHYDVLISEPSNPWMAGVAALFTRELFAAARERLKPNGLFCQWAHTYEIRAADLRSIVETFRSIFPQGTMWLVGDGDLLLIGTNGNSILDRLPGISEHWREGQVPAVLADVGIEASSAPFQMLSLFVGGPAELTRYGNGAQIQTDDKAALEFTAPRAIYARTTESNITALRSLTTWPPFIATTLNSGSPQAWKARGRMALRAAAFDMAYDSFRHAVALDSHDADAYSGVSDAAAGSHRLPEESSWLASLAAAEPSNVEVRLELSHILDDGGDSQAAISAAAEAMRLRPSDPRPLEQLGSIFADMGDGRQLAPIAEQLVSRFPDRKEGFYYQALALFLSGRLAAALDDARQLTAQFPDYAAAQNLLGMLFARASQEDMAQVPFETALRLNPRDPSTYINLGLLYLHLGDPRKAMSYFAEAWALDQSSPAATNGFREAQEAARTQ